MSTYTIHREYVSGREADKAFDNLADAERDFDDACADPKVFRVELIDNSDAKLAVIKVST